MSELQAILQDLADGRIDTETAQRRIGALDRSVEEPESRAEPSDAELSTPRPSDSEPFRRYTPPPPPKGFSPWNWVRGSDGGSRKESSADGKTKLERLEIRGSGQRLRLVGDASVSSVSIDGPHTLRRNGSVLEVSAKSQLRPPSVDPMSLLRARSFSDLRKQALKTPELVVNLNPSLLVDVELTAGGLSSVGVPYLGRIRVSGGTSRLDGVAEIGDALFQMGQASITGTLRTGRSRIRVETGQATVELGEESNVTVRAQTQLGRVSWLNTQSVDPGEVVVGLGNARLDIEAMMAYVSVKLDEQD